MASKAPPARVEALKRTGEGQGCPRRPHAEHSPAGASTERARRQAKPLPLMLEGAQYASGCWWGCFTTPTGCLTASAGGGAEPRGVTAL